MCEYKTGWCRVIWMTPIPAFHDQARPIPLCRAACVEKTSATGEAISMLQNLKVIRVP